MMDSDSAQSTAGFDYDRDGHVVPPAGSLPWDIATFFLAMAIPRMAMQLSMGSPLPPLGLQKLKIFELAIARHLLSESQVRNVELLFVLLIIARLASFPAYLRKYTKLYSGQRRPPDVWRNAWPRQIRLLFLIAVIFIGGVEFTGFLIQLTSYGIGPYAYAMTTRDVNLPIFVLAGGLWFLTGGLLSAALYSVFYRRFWRHAT